jgi:hypothetical protein
MPLLPGITQARYEVNKLPLARKVVGLRRVATEGNGSRGRIREILPENSRRRCQHRTTGLMLSQMQELVRQVHNALTEPWNKGVVARNRVGCTDRPRSHVFSAELFAGVPFGISRRLPC